MYDLFEKHPDGIHIYTRRIPKPDGAPPSLNRLGGAIFLAVFSVTAILSTLYLIEFVTEQFRDPATVIYKVLCYALLGAMSAWYIATQFFKVIVTPSGDIVSDRILYRRRIASLTDLTDIRIMDYEWGGRFYYHYVGLWKKDRLRRPLRLSPLCRTVNQLSHFRRTVIPSIRKFHPAYDYGKGEWSGWPDPPASPPAPPPGRAAPGGDGSKIRVSFWFETIVEIALTAASLIALCYLIWLAGFGMGDYSTYGFAAIGLYFLFPVVTVVATWRFLVFLRDLAFRHQTVVIDSAAQTIETTTVFGYTKNMFTFDSLEDINVKYIRGRQYICLVLQNNMVDPVVAVTYSSEDTRRALRRICDALKLSDMNAWVMQLQAPNKWRHRNFKDPYREPEEGLKSRFKE